MKNALKTILFCLLMGTLSSSVLVGINAITSARITRNEEQKLRSTILDVLGIDYDETTALEIFEKNVQIVEKGDLRIYKSRDNAIAFEFKGPGVWGTIYGVMSLNPDLNTIRKIKIIHHEETPGLGARITEKEYLDRFNNKEVYNGTTITSATKSGSEKETYIISGATYSSKAFKNIITSAIRQFKTSMLR